MLLKILHGNDSMLFQGGIRPNSKTEHPQNVQSDQYLSQTTGNCLDHSIVGMNPISKIQILTSEIKSILY